MIGFYVNVRKGSAEPVRVESCEYETFLRTEALQPQTVYLFKDDKCQRVTSDHLELYSVGTLVYRDKWRQAALDLVAAEIDRRTSLRSIAADAHGQFCLVSVDSGTVNVITDKTGSLPVYAFEDDHTVQISNLLPLLVARNRLSVDYQAVAEYLSFDYCFGGTFYNEIRLLDRGCVYQPNPTLTVETYDDFLADLSSAQDTDLDALTGKITEILKRNLAFLSAQDRVFADFTGGMDSRLNSVLLRSLGLSFETGICGEQVVGESSIARTAAQTLGVPFHAKERMQDAEAFFAVLERHLASCNGVPIPFYSTELVDYYRMIASRADVHVCGFAGSQLFDNFLPRLSLISGNLGSRHVITKTFRLLDIVQHALLKPSDYYSAIAEKIDAFTDRLGTKRHDVIANAFTAQTFCRYYHGSLLGCHNTIMPVYVPYIESDFMRAMIDVSTDLKHNRMLERSVLGELNEAVSGVTTTHGFAANKASIGLRTPKQRAKDIARRLSYDIGVALRLDALVAGGRRAMGSKRQVTAGQRPLWMDLVDREWGKGDRDSEVFDIRRLEAAVDSRMPDAMKLKAKVLHVERVLAEAD